MNFTFQPFCANIINIGLGKGPKCEIPTNALVLGNTSVKMIERLMINYLDKIVAKHLKGRRGLLIMDNYAAHMTDRACFFNDKTDEKYMLHYEIF